MTLTTNTSGSSRKIKTYALVPAVLSLGLFVLSTAMHTTYLAAELNPTENINPSKSQPSLKNHPEAAAMKRDDKRLQSTKRVKAKAGTSWWNWLTNSSSKPAYFHYIDILELLD